MLPDAIDTTSSFNVKDGTKEGNSNNNHNDHSHNHLLEPPPAAPRRGRVSRRHSVGFAPEADRKVVEFDMLEEEMREMFWYSRDEYDIIKARNSLIVKMMKTGHFKESNEHTFRGLEHKLKEGFKKRRANKFNGLNAVLEEQDRQYARGVVHPEAIAEQYSRVAMTAAETAFVVALRDAENSYCFNGANPKNSISLKHPHHHHLLVADSDETKSNNDYSHRDNDAYRPGYVVDDDTIASEESTGSKTRTKIRGLFSAVSMAKRQEGKMNRRSSM